MRTIVEEYEKVIRKNPTVNRAITSGCTLMQIIVMMNEIQEQLTDRIAELEKICPKKLTMPDGKVLVYRAPIELIPEIGIVSETRDFRPDPKSAI